MRGGTNLGFRVPFKNYIDGLYQGEVVMESTNKFWSNR